MNSSRKIVKAYEILLFIRRYAAEKGLPVPGARGTKRVEKKFRKIQKSGAKSLSDAIKKAITDDYTMIRLPISVCQYTVYEAYIKSV